MASKTDELHAEMIRAEVDTMVREIRVWEKAGGEMTRDTAGMVAVLLEGNGLPHAARAVRRRYDRQVT